MKGDFGSCMGNEEEGGWWWWVKYLPRLRLRVREMREESLVAE